MSDDIIQQAAEVLAANWKRMHTNESLGFQRMLAQALADAGLLLGHIEIKVKAVPLTKEEEIAFRKDWDSRVVPSNGGEKAPGSYQSIIGSRPRIARKDAS